MASQLDLDCGKLIVHAVESHVLPSDTGVHRAVESEERGRQEPDGSKGCCQRSGRDCDVHASTIGGMRPQCNAPGAVWMRIEPSVRRLREY